MIARNPAWQEAQGWNRRRQHQRHEAIDDDVLVREWRVEQLTRLGIPWSLAQAAADQVDWRQVARLVRRAALPAARAVVVGDLSGIAGMRQVAEQANAGGPYDAVIHNAGVGYREPRRIRTDDGLAHVFAINVLAPYLLTGLIERPGRLVYLSSGMHRGGDPGLTDPQWEHRRWNGSQAYADSKLFDVVLAFAVARLWTGVLSNALEPGWVPTRMGGPGAPVSRHKKATWSVRSGAGAGGGDTVDGPLPCSAPSVSHSLPGCAIASRSRSSTGCVISVLPVAGPSPPDVPVARALISGSDRPDPQPASAVAVRTHSSARAHRFACPRDVCGLPRASGCVCHGHRSSRVRRQRCSIENLSRSNWHRGVPIKMQFTRYEGCAQG